MDSMREILDRVAAGSGKMDEALGGVDEALTGGQAAFMRAKFERDRRRGKVPTKKTIGPKKCPPGYKMVFGDCRKISSADRHVGNLRSRNRPMEDIFSDLGGVDEAVGSNVITRMADAMLGSPKLAVLLNRSFDDEGQMDMFVGMIQGPLEALIAKALDAAGVAVGGSVLAKSSREMRGAARGGIGKE